MVTDIATRDLNEIARIGADLLDRRIGPTLPASDVGRFVAIDVRTGAFEVDDDDYAAVIRLHARVPGAEVWMARVGDAVADRMGLR